MSHKYSSSKKNKQYIYTEADLGEGILEEGVSVEYTILQKVSNRYKSVADAHMLDSLQNKNNREVVNIDEDFSYAYYC